MPTIDAILARAAEAAPRRIAVHEADTGRRVDYATLDRWVSALARRLAAAGIGPGSRVGLHLPNGAHFLVAQFGALRAGTVASYVNHRLHPVEAVRQLAMAEVRAIVTTAERAAAFRDEPALRGALVLVSEGGSPAGESLPELLAAAPCAPFRPPDGLEEADAIARFTSGSTGAPKAVLVTHRAWTIRATSLLAEEICVEPGSATMVLGALSHQAGLFVLPTMMRRGTLVTFERFDLDRAAALLRSEPVATMQVVPTMLRMILEHRAMSDALAGAGVHRIVYGGSPIESDVIAGILGLVPDCEVTQSYGSHEAGSISHLDAAGHRDPVLRRSAGRPFLCAEIRVTPVAGSEHGEIEVRAPWTPRARLTERGREPVLEDWVPTGDLGEMRDGYLFLMDRANDVIVSGGFNVYPKEVETVLSDHPSVATCAVVSEPDSTWGERVIAFCVPRPGSRIDEAQLREHCRGRLAGFKVPKAFRAIDDMPLNANGKPDRRRLSDPLWAGRDRRIN